MHNDTFDGGAYRYAYREDKRMFILVKHIPSSFMIEISTIKNDNYNPAFIGRVAYEWSIDEQTISASDAIRLLTVDTILRVRSGEWTTGATSWDGAPSWFANAFGRDDGEVVKPTPRKIHIIRARS